MYSKGHYARQKIFSSISNFIWKAIMLAAVAALIGVCVYGCQRFFSVMGPTIE